MTMQRIETIKETTASMGGSVFGEVTKTIPKGTILTFIPNAGDCSGYAVLNPLQFGFNSHDSKYRYAYLPKNNMAVFHIKLIREPLKSKSDNWQETAREWLVKIAGQEFGYYTGSGIKDIPSYDSVLESLLSDYDVLTMEFEEFCSNFGYDEDSRKAYKIWLSCCNNGRKLIATGIDIEVERARIQE